jgi:molybdopterin synthase sulfur carrier subunit
LEVDVKFYAMLREATGKKVETVVLPEKSSVGDLIDLLVERHGDRFGYYVYDKQKRVRDYLSFMLNGVNVNSLSGFETLLNDGDIVSLLPPIGGG